MKIGNCSCGRKAVSYTIIVTGRIFMQCSRLNCWEGPVRKTEKEAVKAWNKVMEKGDKK